MSLEAELRAEIARLTKELEEANEAVIAALMLGFEKGRDAAKAELVEARKVIEALLEDSAAKEDGTEFQSSEAARAFLAAKETQG